MRSSRRGLRVVLMHGDFNGLNPSNLLRVASAFRIKRLELLEPLEHLEPPPFSLTIRDPIVDDQGVLAACVMATSCGPCGTMTLCWLTLSPSLVFNSRKTIVESTVSPPSTRKAEIEGQVLIIDYGRGFDYGRWHGLSVTDRIRRTLYHLTSRGNERKAIFKDDTDRQLFLETLARATERFHWFCHAYCLMDNHYHLVVETPDGNLSQGMRQLNGVYTQIYNRRHRRVGHLFQGRFKGILVQKESHFLEVCRYVVLNPVAAGIVKHPRQWAWSSYRATSGESAAVRCLTVEEVLGQFGKRRGLAQKNYRQFVMEGIGRASIWDNLEAQSLLGEEGFAEALKGYVTGQERIQEIPRRQRLIGRPRLKDLFKSEGQQGAKRDRMILKAVHEYGYSQVEVARHLRLHYSTLSRIVKLVGEGQE